MSSEKFSIRSEDPNSPDAQTLLDELLIGPYCRFDRETVNGAVLARVEMAAAQFGFLALNSEVSEQNLRMLVLLGSRLHPDRKYIRSPFSWAWRVLLAKASASGG